jgi:hypothetical protein
MRKVILQFCTEEQSKILALAKQYNEVWAQKMGYEYVPGSGRKHPDRNLVWEKISYLMEVLPKFEDGSLMVWEDADSINVKDVSFESALPSNESYGMVQLRGGLDKKQLTPWFNSGVIVMRNSPTLRDFFNRVWKRSEHDSDERGIMAELKHHNWTIGGGIKVYSMNYKWNRWRNNDHLCPEADAVVQSWHGMKLEDKLSAMETFLKNRSNN